MPQRAEGLDSPHALIVVQVVILVFQIRHPTFSEAPICSKPPKPLFACARRTRSCHGTLTSLTT